MNSITIQDFKELKIEAEEDIMEILNKLSEDTGVSLFVEVRKVHEEGTNYRAFIKGNI